MSSQTNPLLGPDDAHAQPSRDQPSAKRVYHAPELRELGAVGDLTKTSEEGSYAEDSPPYES